MKISSALQDRLKWDKKTTEGFLDDFNKLLPWLPALRRMDVNWEYPDKPSYPNQIEGDGVGKYYKKQVEKAAHGLEDMDSAPRWDVTRQLIAQLDPEWDGQHVDTSNSRHTRALKMVDMVIAAATASAESFNKGGEATARVKKMRNRHGEFASDDCLNTMLSVVNKHDAALANKTPHDSCPLHALVDKLFNAAGEYEALHIDDYDGHPVLGEDAKRNLVKRIKKEVKTGLKDPEYWLQ